MTTKHCNSDSIFSPSFNAHSSHRLEDIAARVISELSSNESNPDDELDFNPICDEIWAQEESGNDENEDEFEFPLISRDWVSCPVSRYPVFNTDLLREAELVMDRRYEEEEEKPPPPPPPVAEAEKEKEEVIRLPLKMLFEEERKKSESEGLEGIPVGTYCVWKPKKALESEADEEEEERRRRRQRWSNKSGLLSSKRWKWPGLLQRSNSDIVGKGRLVFFDPVKNSEDKKVEEKVVKLKMAAVSPEKLAEHGGDKWRSIWSVSFNKSSGMNWS